MEVIIYTIPTCDFCGKEKKVSFQERDLTEEDTFREEVLKNTGQLSTPVIVIDGKFIVGFDKDKLEAALKE